MGANSIDFSDRLREAKDLADTLQPKEIKGVTSVEDERSQRLADLAVIDPRAAISEAWLDVEDALKRAAARYHLPLPESGRIAGPLFMRGKIGADTYEVFKSLRDLRNLVEHERTAEEITTTQALEYCDFSRRLVAKLDSA